MTQKKLPNHMESVGTLAVVWVTGELGGETVEY